mgnify:CR=1 FL=1
MEATCLTKKLRGNGSKSSVLVRFPSCSTICPTPSISSKILRCGFQTEEEIIGKFNREVFPIEIAEKYMNDDRKVIASKEPLIEIVDLFPNQIGEPEWFVTNKIPLFDQDGKVA